MCALNKQGFKGRGNMVSCFEIIVFNCLFDTGLYNPLELYVFRQCIENRTGADSM